MPESVKITILLDLPETLEILFLEEELRLQEDLKIYFLSLDEEGEEKVRM
jgi:hypothetical protein